MIKGPLFSIITINYNDCVGLQRTLDSVVNQSYQDFEYIVIDGGSDDGSKDLLDLYNDKIDYCISEKDTGVYNAMNKGLVKATGQYVLFLNSGDELYSLSVLEDNYRKIHTEDLVYFNLLQAFENNTNEHEFPSELNFNTFLKGTIGHPTTFIKRSLFNKIGLYDETLKIVADWKFFILAVVKYDCSYKKIAATLSKFYMDGMSTTNVKETDRERSIVLNEHFSDYLRLNLLEAVVSELKKSRLLKLLNRFGFIKAIEKI
jgi:glycosyltransferase involved in cell wall biosynthesis